MVVIKINKLAGIIASRELTKTFVSDMLGINRRALFNKMKDPDTFTKREIDKLMKFFNVTYEELF
jgi:hypothetical protein